MEVEFAQEGKISKGKAKEGSRNKIKFVLSGLDYVQTLIKISKSFPSALVGSNIFVNILRYQVHLRVNFLTTVSTQTIGNETGCLASLLSPEALKNMTQAVPIDPEYCKRNGLILTDVARKKRVWLKMEIEKPSSDVIINLLIKVFNIIRRSIKGGQT